MKKLTNIRTSVLLSLLFILIGCTKKSENKFTLWQLPSQVNTIGNSYVFKSQNGKIVVMDGGSHTEELYLRGFLAALGNEVEAWFISHPHEDHVGTITQILKDPNELKIKKIYHSEFPEQLIELEQEYKQHVYAYHDALKNSGMEVVNLTEPGLQLDIDGINIKVLGVTNPEFTMNPYNNSSSIFRVWDDTKTMVFLGDAGVECGNKVLNGPYREDLDCDYLQMAHHGQAGCDENFYNTVNFRACLWPTPTWVWNNDAGEGYNTAWMTTIETREWMDKKGITEHYISWQGLAKIE